MTLLNQALSYAAAGYPVFPAKSTADKTAGSKAPHLPGESKAGRKDGGHWLATRDARQISAWWRRWPRALIGFPTGLRSACVVIDLDPREYKATEMLAALTRWCGHLRHVDSETGEVLEPAIAKTQSGGLHLYFAWPAEATFADGARRLAHSTETASGMIGNRTGLFRAFLKAGEAPAQLSHIDVRGEGGYVIAPPSVMSDGRRYEWLVPRQGDLPPLPMRLLGVITGEIVPISARQLREKVQRQTHVFPGHESGTDQLRAVVDRAVRGALRSARHAGEGNRNAAVFWAACRLGEFVRGGVLDKTVAEQLLLGSLPAGVSPDEHKIRATIKNGLSNTKGSPLSPDVLARRRGP